MQALRKSTQTPEGQASKDQHPSPPKKKLHDLKLGVIFSPMLAGHVARDLSHQLRASPFQAAIEKVMLPVHKGEAVVLEEHFIVMPHKLWASMYNFDQTLFLQHFLGANADNASRFWKGLNGTHLLGKLNKLNLDPAKTVPLKLFGDGIACTGISKAWSKSADTYLVASLLARSKVSEAPGHTT